MKELSLLTSFLAQFPHLTLPYKAEY